MKKHFLSFILLLMIISTSYSQAKKTVSKEKSTAPSEMDKAMEDAMKGMSEEEKAEMRNVMKDIMPDMAKKPGSDFASFSDNKKLVPARDPLRINSISKKAFTDAEININTVQLYSKLMAKIPAEEKTIITKVLCRQKADLL